MERYWKGAEVADSWIIAELFALVFLTVVYISPIPVYVMVICTVGLITLRAHLSWLFSIDNLKAVENSDVAWQSELTRRFAFSNAEERLKSEQTPVFDWRLASQQALDDIRAAREDERETRRLVGAHYGTRVAVLLLMLLATLIRPAAATGLAFLANNFGPEWLNAAFS